MKNKTLHFLSEQYPYLYEGKSLSVIISLLFFMTLFFGYLFEPFEVYTPEHKMDYFFICFIHALTPCVLLILGSFFRISPIIKEKWTIKKEVLFIVFLLASVGLVQFLIRDILYNNPNNWSWHYFFEEVRNAFLVGSLFIFILVPLNFNRLNKRNRENAQTINSLNTNTSNSTAIEINNIHIDFDLQNMLFAKAAGNYVELYFKNGSKTLKRTTIKNLASILVEESFIIKTHRSYLVNIHYIDTVSGNAQGYKLRLKHYADKIPVSRNMISVFNAKMQNS